VLALREAALKRSWNIVESRMWPDGAKENGERCMDKEQWPRSISTLGRNRRPAVEERNRDLRLFKESMPWPLWSSWLHFLIRIPGNKKPVHKVPGNKDPLVNHTMMSINSGRMMPGFYDILMTLYRFGASVLQRSSSLRCCPRHQSEQTRRNHHCHARF